MSDNENKEPELVVDTDWKSQVEKEKQETSKQDDDFVAKDQLDPGGDPTQDLPPANLSMLISTFYSQAMMALGVMENPNTGKKETDLVVAKHFIDTLEMLQEKTQGNTDENESKMFDEVLHLLRMAYVGATKS